MLVLNSICLLITERAQACHTKKRINDCSEHIKLNRSSQDFFLQNFVQESHRDRFHLKLLHMNKIY
ncbi:hypothetical protein BpHYR1_029378 [Brachionus plicatilis]|uniref:Secreted protein n=1 Tax=Brachionus plicatilis TaxID=10195 RepID=A0A3M7PBE7_BRAPC|nr:hypothetical protein BpHYR1_029378 [Brachionus plicatilis]